MDLFQALPRVLEALRQSGVEWALCGGFALAAHGIVRATEDIDVIAEEGSLPRIRDAIARLGFRAHRRVMVFKSGRVRIQRFIKLQPKEGEPLILDVLSVTEATRPAWETRKPLETGFGAVPVVSRAGLIQLKSLRASGQDLDDIEQLKRHEARD